MTQIPALWPPLGITEWPVDPTRLLHPTHTALMLLDVQNRYLPLGGEARAAGVVTSIEQLLATAREVGVLPICVRIREIDRELGRSGPYLQRLQTAQGARSSSSPVSPPDPQGSEFVPELWPGPSDIVVEKVRFSAFFATWLDHLLKNRGIRTLVLTGMASYGAVIATTFDAAWRDYYQVVPPTTVGGQNQKLHEAAMTLIGQQCFVEEESIREIWSTWARQVEAGQRQP